MKIKKIKINGTTYKVEGKSAYEIACEHGFEGSEAEWLESLKGETGEKGADGKDAEITNLAQSTGDSESQAMSQKAVTDELNLIHTGSIIPIDVVWESGGLDKTGGETASTTWMRIAEKIKVRKNAELHVLSTNKNVGAFVCEYDANGVGFSRRSMASSIDGHFIPSDECAYVRVGVYSTSVPQEDLTSYVQMWYGVLSLDKLNDKIDNKMIRQIYPFDNILIKSINHRGFNSIAPENTLPAYRLSAQKGFPFVECDLSITVDGKWVLIHDDTIDRTSNGTGNITEMTLEQVKTYDFGSWKDDKYAGTQIPTLEEFIILCRDLGLYPYLEIKNTANYTQEQIDALVAIVKCYGMEKAVSYISFNEGNLEKIVNASKVARIGLLWAGNSITQGRITEFKCLDTGVNQLFIDMSASYVTEDDIALCKSNGLPLEIYCPNTESGILNANDYITGFTSDNLVASEVIKNANIGDADGLL